MPFEESSFRDRLEAVEGRIARAAEAAGRRRSEITVVAVTKKFSASRVKEAYQHGLREFGENYVQEFADKLPDLHGLSDARFHLIGHLQSNKARSACDLFQVIQTVDSVKLLTRLDAAAAERNAKLETLLEIKLSPEQSKAGASPDAIPVLLDAASGCSSLHVSGLMTIPPWSEEPENSRPYFQKLASLAHRYGLPRISMGMSGDFEVAIQEGATMIRVGTALFGARPKPGLAPSSVRA